MINNIFIHANSVHGDFNSPTTFDKALNSHRKHFIVDICDENGAILYCVYDKQKIGTFVSILLRAFFM